LPIWQAIVAGIATLEELETTWSLDDLARGLSMLAFKSDVEAWMMDDVARKVKAGRG
jgi:hypothetical protein